MSHAARLVAAERRIARLEEQVTAIVEAYEALIAGHNHADEQIRALKLRLTYTMERVVVRKVVKEGGLLTRAETETKPIAYFWLDEGAEYTRGVLAQAKAVEDALAHDAEQAALQSRLAHDEGDGQSDSALGGEPAETEPAPAGEGITPATDDTAPERIRH